MSNQTAGPFGTPEPTTAQILGQYRRDLEAQGFDDNAAHALVRQVAMTIHRDGLRVSQRRDECECFARDCHHSRISAVKLYDSIVAKERGDAVELIRRALDGHLS